MPDGHIRSFVAIPVPLELGAALDALTRRLAALPGGDRVRWTRRENLHVTLCFLGDIDESRVPRVLEELGERVPAHEAFELALLRADLFPNRRRPRVVACELAPAEPLAALAHSVKEGVTAAGLPTEERVFRGHLTLGRFRDPRSELDVTASDTAVSDPLPVTEVVLFHSKLQRSGALHTPLGQAALRPPSVAFTPNSTKNHKKGSKRHG